MRLLPASPRRRRRLAWTALSLVALAAAGVSIALLPGGEPVPQTPLRTGRDEAAAALPPLRLTPDRRREIDAVVHRFAVQAAARRDPRAAWADASAAMHANISRADWDAGNLPGVVPFDPDALGGVSWRVVYRAPDRVGLDVLLVAKPGARQRTIVYAADLVLEEGRFFVDSWVPRESLGGAAPARAKGETTAAATQPQPAQGKLDPRWLLVPAGLLALVVLIPLGLLARNIIRDRRAYRRYRRAGS
jgi:hypothetical protein